MPSKNEDAGRPDENRCPDCGSSIAASGGVCPVCGFGASQEEVLGEVGDIIQGIIDTDSPADSGLSPSEPPQPEPAGPNAGDDEPAGDSAASQGSGNPSPIVLEEIDGAGSDAVPGLDGIEDLIEKISNPDTLFGHASSDASAKRGIPPIGVKPAAPAAPEHGGIAGKAGKQQGKVAEKGAPHRKKPKPAIPEEDEVSKVRRITMVERRRKGTKLIRRGKLQCGNCHQIFDLAKLPSGTEKCLNCGSKMLQKYIDPLEAPFLEPVEDVEEQVVDDEAGEDPDQGDDASGQDAVTADEADAVGDGVSPADGEEDEPSATPPQETGEDDARGGDHAVKRQGQKDYYADFRDEGNIYADLDVDTRGEAPAQCPGAAGPADAASPGGWGEALKGELGIKKRSEEEAVLRDDYFLNKKIGQYLVMAVIGRGGMGTVFRAREESGRLVALKILPPMFSRDQSKVDRFMREAEASRRLDHPNIVKCFDFGTEGDVNFIAMELVEGKSVGDLIKEKRAVKIEESLRIIKHVAEALQSAHDRGIIHRDIKPDNIMIHGNGLIQVADFGLARDIEAGGSLSGTGEIVGTPYYISPEQIDCLDVDARADIYSLGATIYHLVTGKRPFEGETPMEVLLKHVNEKLVPPLDLNSLIPLPVGRVMQKMMEKHREFRYQNCAELISDIVMIEKGAMPAIVLEEETEPRKIAVPPVVTRGRPVALLTFLWLAAVAVAALAARSYLLPSIDESPMLAPKQKSDNTAQLALKEAIAFLEDNPDEIAEAVSRLRSVAAGMKGSEEADRALRKAEDLEKKLQDEMEKWASERCDAARAIESRGRPGRALIELAAGPPRRLAGVPRPQFMDAESNRLAAELARRGQALISAGKVQDRARGGAGATVRVEAFLLDMAEVSCGEYAEFVRATGARQPWGEPGLTPAIENLPVAGVDFKEASMYAAWRGKRLPTEQEWEIAAAGAEGRTYPFGKFFDPARAVSRASGSGGPLEVHALPEGRTPEGVFNMAGNVHEWTSTTSQGGQAVARGGSFDSHPHNLRTDARLLLDPGTRDRTLGFRLAADP